MIVNEGDRVLLVDLESSNGTLVGGRPVKKHPLQRGDHFTIAESTFVFEDGTDGQARAPIELPDGPTENEEDDTNEFRAVTQADLAEEGTVFAGRSTVELGPATVDAPTEPAAPDEARSASGSTVELESAGGDMPVAFPPPRGEFEAPEVKPPELAYTEVAASFPPSKASAVTIAAESEYEGDLLDDITVYRSFRLRLARDEIPTGEEVARMIDLEPRLRNPGAEADPMRDVVAQRFFRRFRFVAPMTARFSLPRRTIHLQGCVADLSVDGLRCSLEQSDYVPTVDQFAVLIIEGPRVDRIVQFMFTSRVVWVKGEEVGFVFSGAPSWKARAAEEEEAKTIAEDRGPPRG